MSRSGGKNPVVSAAERHARDLTGRMIHAAVPYTPPWLLSAAMYPTAEAAHVRFGASPWTSVGMTLVDVALTGVAWESASSRSPITRVHGALSAAAASAWVTAATIAGAGHAITNVYLLGGGALCVSWNIRRATRNTGTSESGESGDGGLFAKVKLAGARVVHTKVEPNKVTAKLKLVSGEQTVDDVVRAKNLIASGLSTTRNGVRIQADGPEDEVTLVIVPKDVLKTPEPYRGSQSPGASPAEPIIFGRYEDMSLAMLYFTADEDLARNLVHLMLMGCSGSGKSAAARVILAELAARRELSVWAIDVVKRHQTLGCAAGLLDWFATTRVQAEAMLDCLPEVIAARTDFLASRGLDNWVPGCGLNLLVVWIEEAPAALRDSKTFNDTAAAARSAGVVLVPSLQRASHTQMDTDTRANLGASLCFGVNDASDAQFALPPEVIEAGANPGFWKADYPGYCYLVAPGVSQERRITPLRTFKLSQAELTDIIKETEHLRDPLDQVTIMAAGQAYKTRTAGQATTAVADRNPAATLSPAGDHGTTAVPIPAPRNEAAPAMTATASSPVPNMENSDMDHAEEQIPAEVARYLPKVEFPVSEEPDIMAAGFAFGDGELISPLGDDADEADQEPEATPMSPEAAREVVHAAIRRLLAEGQVEFGVPDMADVLEETGRSRPWLVGYVRKLVSYKVLDQSAHGTYRIRPEAFERELANA